MKKMQVMYQANIDYEATIKKARNQGIKPQFGGGRRTKGGDSPEAQMILDLKDLDTKILVTPKGKIQIWYPSLPKLRKGFQILKRILVPQSEKLILKAKGPNDPLDLSFETMTIEHTQHSDVKFSSAKIPIYAFRHLKTGDLVLETLDREGCVHVPGTDYRVKPSNLEHFLVKTPYICEDHFDIGVHTIDKFDKDGNKIITGDLLRWKAIQEIKRILPGRIPFKDDELTPPPQPLKPLDFTKLDLFFTIPPPKSWLRNNGKEN